MPGERRAIALRLSIAGSLAVTSTAAGLLSSGSMRYPEFGLLGTFVTWRISGEQALAVSVMEQVARSSQSPACSIVARTSVLSVAEQ